MVSKGAHGPNKFRIFPANEPYNKESKSGDEHQDQSGMVQVPLHSAFPFHLVENPNVLMREGVWQ